MNADASTGDDADVISKGIITISQAQDLLLVFKQEISKWCLIRPPLDCDLATMRRERPQLLLSSMIVASEKRITLQKALTQEYQDGLARKAIVEGRKDLDLLEGLVMYIAW